MTRQLSDIRHIVIHHSATPEEFPVSVIRRIHLDLGYRDVGYHYLITREKGKWMLRAGRPVTMAGAHVVQDIPVRECGLQIDNHNSIGLCLIGNFAGKDPFPEVVNEAAYAVKILAEKFRVPLTRDGVIPHSRVSRTACPGARTMEMIYERLGI